MAKTTIQRMTVLVVAAVVACFLLVACSGGTSGSASGQASSGASGSGSSSASSSALVPSQSDLLISKYSVLKYVGDEGCVKLMADMEDGRTPVNCNVLYDTMGARPDVDITDPEEIAKVYELLAMVNVSERLTAMPVTDSYHHVIFTLQDGTKVGFNFEGAGVWVKDGKDYPVVNDEVLWAYVYQLQEVQMGNATMGARHAIKVGSDEDLIIDAPREARAGDVVVVHTIDVTDVEMHVTANGVEVEYVGGAYVFVMPDTDVTLHAFTKDYPFGGGA